MTKHSNMDNSLKDLIEISRFYGRNKEAVIAGGGNTSFKDDKFIWVKASGTSLANINENGFVKLYRDRLQVLAVKTYSSDPDEREMQVKEDLYASCVDTSRVLRPSVETSLHETLNYPFVVHLHPTLVNALLCGKDSEKITAQLFGKEALYIPYTDPGYILFKKISNAVSNYRKSFQNDPKLLFLENHGIFLSANTIAEIRALYDQVNEKIQSKIHHIPVWENIPVKNEISQILPGLRMMVSDDGLKVLRIRHNSLISNFYKDESAFDNISKPFTPDIIVYCKANYLFIDKSKPEEILESLREKLSSFQRKNGYLPKIVLIKNLGLLAIEDSSHSAEIALDIFEDMMKISYFAESFGGPRPMNNEQINFIETWELENYRRKVAKGAGSIGKIAGKIAIVTGAAMGFGAGIAADLAKEGAHVIIADINAEEGLRTQENINSLIGKKQSVFVKTDVSSPDSIEELIKKTVELFGGLDIMVSNAGILRAGSLEEMDFQTFERMTSINYSAYFLCAKYASAVMKLQHQYNSQHFSDIIQINSKSGLKGSNKNFAYAGGKFGGIGLTQSFALELMPFNIKVNSICPGNFFDGPLWSDPEKGLFVQYLKTGKVPGAKTVYDVRKFYEDQVPAKRGCRIEDVMKAMYYIIDQQYETGQAVPVTGGQSMLH
jgi:rhamnose utilization protein RhaD (predicted bifunctional aldolase and dehydrogenase)/NAD(P)-dependent dehydrogenase (short-subunit alcohol dehydrogenase family)